MSTNSSASGSNIVSGVEVYSPTARFFHWLTVLLVVVQVPIGLYMVYRGVDLKIWDSVTNTLYSSHKLLGVIILTVVVLRLLRRLFGGVPGHEPTIEAWQKVLSTVVHWSLYAMLFIVPVLGYLGSAYFGALTLFGVIKLPALVPVDKEMSKQFLEYHHFAVRILLGLVAVHVAAAIYHAAIRGDNVLGRMWLSMIRPK